MGSLVVVDPTIVEKCSSVKERPAERKGVIESMRDVDGVLSQSGAVSVV